MDTRSKWVPMAAIAAVLGTPMALQLERGRDGLKVDATLVGTRTLMPSVLASGTLTYRSQATLTPEIIGRVREIRVAEGDRVRKGDVMMRIDAEAYRAEVAQYEAAVAQASLAIDRARYNREYQASKLAELPSIPCIVSNPEEDQILVRQIVENWERAQLHPFEIADALAQLRDDKGYTQKKLAEETGKPEAEISKFLKLLDLDPAVQRDARADTTGTLSFRHLYNVARLETSEQAAIVSAVREQRLTATDTEKSVRKSIERRATTAKRGAR